MINGSPKVSVIIPSYNHEKFIGEAIQSVLNQTFDDFELLIIDDASTDASMNIIESFTDHRIKIYRNNSNCGGSFTANFGIKKAVGKYIAILNSDDVFLPNKLEKQVQCLDQNQNLGAVFSLAEIINENGKSYGDKSNHYFSIFKQENRSRFEWLRYLFYYGNCLCHPSILIRKECYEKVGLYKENLVQLPDFDMWIRLLFHFDIHILQENLIRFRIRERNMNASSTRPDTRNRDSIEFCEVLKNYLEMKGYDLAQRIFPSEIASLSDSVVPAYVSKMALDAGEETRYELKYFGGSHLLEYFQDSLLRNQIIKELRISYADYLKYTGCFHFGELTFAQLFVDVGQGYEEVNSIKRQINGNDINLEFDVSKFSAITKLRFDPMNGAGCVKLITIELKDDSGMVKKETKFKSNAYHTWENNYLFLHDDPQIFDIFPPVSMKLKHVKCTFELQPLNSQHLKEILERDSKVLQTQKNVEGKLLSTESEINKLSKKNEELLEDVNEKSIAIIDLDKQNEKNNTEISKLTEVIKLMKAEYIKLQNKFENEKEKLVMTVNDLESRMTALLKEFDSLKLKYDEAGCSSEKYKLMFNEILGKYNAVINGVSFRTGRVITFPIRVMRKVLSLCMKFLNTSWKEGLIIGCRKSIEYCRMPSQSSMVKVNECEKRTLCQDFAKNSEKKSHVSVLYENEQFPSINVNEVKPIAFYFPQFHPFPENDKFWGKGFTEWNNVTKAEPLFPGHSQPRLPGELGFYDTRVKDVLKRQIELAKKYGIFGFCFHHYFFDGRPVMRVPYNLMLANKDLDIPFCLHWANEPWTVRWDGCQEKKGVLLPQHHNAEDDIAFMDDIRPALLDSRYIKIEGRPLLIVYRPSLFPSIESTIERWRNYCKKYGIGDLFLATMQTCFDGNVDPRQYGFDAAIEYPPHNTNLTKINQQYNFYDDQFDGNVFSYDQMIENLGSRKVEDYTLFRGAMPDWDCTPRRKNPDIIIGSTPGKFERLLRSQVKFTKDNLSDDKRFLFINAWNEWAEGAYLEPDKRYGYGFLNAVSRALTPARERVAVIVHLFHDEIAEEIISYLKNIPCEFEIYITTHESAVLRLISLFREHFDEKKVHVVGVPNRGRDIAPFIIEHRKIVEEYDLVCFLHSKKNNVYGLNTNLNGWRRYLYGNLLNSFEKVESIFKMFRDDKNLGFVMPEHFPPIVKNMEWGSNFKYANELCKKMRIEIHEEDNLEFPSGSMFWFRPKAISQIFKLDLNYNDFEEGVGGEDGTLAHAFERIFLKVVSHNGFSYEKILFEPANENLRKLFRNRMDISLTDCKLRVAIVIHVYYLEMLDESLQYLSNLPQFVDIHVTLIAQNKDVVTRKFTDSLRNKCFFHVVSNKGRDILPFLTVLKKIHAHYDVICKVHLKKSVHCEDHQNWRSYLFENLLGTKELIRSVITAFVEDNDLGILYPKTYAGVAEWNAQDCWRGNWSLCKQLSEKLDIYITREKAVDFPSGSMFWVRTKALESLIVLDLSESDFEEEMWQLDDTLAHALERLFGVITERNGYNQCQLNITNN